MNGHCEWIVCKLASKRQPFCRSFLVMKKRQLDPSSHFYLLLYYFAWKWGIRLRLNDQFNGYVANIKINIPDCIGLR